MIWTIARKEDLKNAIDNELFYTMSQTETLTNKRYVTIMKALTQGRMRKRLYHERDEEIYSPEDRPGGARRIVVIKGRDIKDCFDV